MKKMLKNIKIITFIIYDASTYGGIESVTRQLTSIFANKEKIHVNVVMFESRLDHKDNYGFDAKVNMYKLKKRNKFLSFLYQSHFVNHLKSDFVIFQGFDCVNYLNSLSFYFIRAKKIFCDHGDTKLEFAYNNEYFSNRIRNVLKTCNYMVCLTEQSKKFYIMKYSKYYNKIVVIPNFICNINHEPYNHKSTNIVCVSRLDSKKNILELVQLFGKNIFPKFPSWKLSLYVSDSFYKVDHLKKIIKNTKFENNFIIKKPTLNKEEIYNNKAFLVFPSLEEGFGMVALEAISCGLPVIGFNINGVNSIVKNKINGILVEEGDFELFKKAIFRLMADEKLRVGYSLNCIDSISCFTIDIVLEKWEKLLDIR